MCIFITLCQKGVASANTLPNVLKELPYDFSVETCSFVAMAHHSLMKNKTQNILFIADGWNDLYGHGSGCLTERTLLHKLLFGNLVSNVTILLTSRSTIMSEQCPENNLDLRSFDRIVSLRGFSGETIESLSMLNLAATLR